MNKFILCTIWLLAAATTECAADTPLNPTPTPTPTPSPSPSLTPSPSPSPSPSPAPVTNLTPGSLNLNPVINKLQGRSSNDQSPPVSPSVNRPQGEAPKRSLTLAPRPATAKTKPLVHGKAHVSSTGSSAGARANSSKKRSNGSFVSDLNDAEILKNTKNTVTVGKESSLSGGKLTSSTTTKQSNLIKGIDGIAAGDAHDHQQQGSSGSGDHITTGAVIGEVIVKGTSAPATNAVASTRTMSSSSGYITLGAVLVSAIAAFAW